MGNDVTNFFCSWSGGKDSCLALYRAIEKGWKPNILLTMMIEDGARSRSHGLLPEVIKNQADSLGIGLDVCSAAWGDYERKFIDRIKGYKDRGIDTGVFGDIDLDQHLEWIEMACSKAGIKPWEPLWKEKRRALLEEFLSLGFKAVIVAVNAEKLDKSFLGRTLDQNLIAQLESIGVDASGEEGEFHTVVTDGPLFSFPIELKFGQQVYHDGYWFQDVGVESAP